MTREILKQLVYLTYLGKGYPEHVIKTNTQKEYEERVSHQIDNALDYVFYQTPTDAEVDALFPGLSFDDMSLNDKLLDAAIEYSMRCSAYSWVRGTTTPEFRKMLYDAKRRIFASLHQHRKRIVSETLLKRTNPDGTFENFIRYDVTLSDDTQHTTCMPWYDVKAYYEKKLAFKLQRKKQDYVPYESAYEFPIDESEQNNIIRQGGACELLSFIIAALLPAEKIKKASKKKLVKKPVQKKPAFQKKPYQKKPYQQKRDGYQPRPGGYQPKPYYNKHNDSYTADSSAYHKPYQSAGTGEKIMRHRRPRIARPAAPPPTEDLLTVDTGNITL